MDKANIKSVSTVKNAESGKPVSRETADAIARGLHKTLDEICQSAAVLSSDQKHGVVKQDHSAKPDTPRSAEEYGFRIEFGTIAQATLTIAEAKWAEELQHMIFGRERGNQYEFITFCRALQGCKRALDQAWQSFPSISLTGIAFPESVVLQIRLEVNNRTDQVAAFHIEEGVVRDLVTDPTKTGAARILYEVRKGGRVELRRRQSLYVNLEIACFYRYDDFPRVDPSDAWARSYLQAAQCLRDYLLRAKHASSALPMDLNVLYGDGSQAEVRLLIQIPRVPEAFQNWPCDIDGLSMALADLHATADPLYKLHEIRRLQLAVLQRLEPEEQRQIEVHRRKALEQVLQAASDVHPKGPHTDASGRIDRILAQIEAYHRVNHG